MHRAILVALPLATACAPVVEFDDRWTVGLYMAADNNLDPFATRDLDEITTAGVPDGVDLYVLLDRTPAGDFEVATPQAVDLFEDARLLQVVGRQVTELEPWGEVDMSDPATLARFTTFLADQQTENNALFLWDHGGGTTFATDETDGRRAMRLPDLAEAVSEGFGPRRTLDLIGFDACLMASMASLTTLDGVAELLVASAELEPGPGWPYPDVMRALRPGSDGRVERDALAIDLVDAYGRAYEGSTKRYQPRLSAWRLDADLKDALDDLSAAEEAAEQADDEGWWRTINRAVAGSRPYGAPKTGTVARYVDMGDLLDGLARTEVAQEATSVRQRLLDSRLAVAPPLEDDTALALNLALDRELRFEVTEGSGRFADTVGRATDRGEGSLQEELAERDTTPPTATLTGVERVSNTLFEVVNLELSFTEDVGIDEGYLTLSRRPQGSATVSLYGVAELAARGLTALDSPTAIQVLSLGLTADATEDGPSIATLVVGSFGRFATVLLRKGDGIDRGAKLVLNDRLEVGGVVIEESNGTVSDWSLGELVEQQAQLAPILLEWDTTADALTPTVGSFFDIADLMPTIVPVTGDDIEVDLVLSDVAGNRAATTPVRPFDLPAP